VIGVNDTGVGISAATLPHIFDMFMQGDDPAGQPRDGLGIGLTLARRLIELHEGRIERRATDRGRAPRLRSACHHPTSERSRRSAKREGGPVPP
jgi:K+-sensing histidine kinase KdpD